MRIVIKIGSSSLTAKQELDLTKLTDHVLAAAKLKEAGHEVIIVSSGAVAAGYKLLGYPSRPVTLKGKQAAAAIGQSILIQHYTNSFKQFNYYVAQLLLTKADFTHKKRFQNAYATISELLERGIIPIINENDTISTEELSFGDNDMLSSVVAAHIHADYLIILTDVNGLYTGNPLKDPNAQKIQTVHEITDDIINMAAGTSSKVGTGGMATKIYAAKYAVENGVNTFVGYGKGADKLTNIINQNGDGTYFYKTSTQQKSLHRWLTLTQPKAKVFIDRGAYEAILHHGKSLLYAGVISIEGHFECGDVVEVFFEEYLVGRGEAGISSDDLQSMNNNIQNESKSVLIHRNHWIKAEEAK